MDDSPLPEGTEVIFMHPTDGHAGFGFTDIEGNFAIESRRGGKTYDGMPVGKYEVMIVPSSEVDVDQLTADEMLEGKAPEASEPVVQIPKRYFRAKTSGLSYDVVDGDNNFKINLTQEEG